MDLYYTLRALSEIVYDVRSVIYSMAVKINGVYLLGAYIYPYAASLSAYIGFVASRVAEAADDYLRFRADILSRVSSNPDLMQIIYYADVLLGIARDTGWFIRSGIRQYFPRLNDLDNNLTQTIINVLTSATGLTYSFITNPSSFIAAAINSTLGELITLRNSPRNFIIDKLAQFVPDLRYFLTDPKGWLRSEFANISPGLNDFLRDPDKFILDKVVQGFERFMDLYGARLAKIAENIINKMF